MKKSELVKLNPFLKKCFLILKHIHGEEYAKNSLREFYKNKK